MESCYGGMPRKLTIGRESGSGTGERGLVSAPIRIAMPVGAWLSNLSPKKAATEAKGRACAVASSAGDGRGTAYLELVNKNNRHFDSAVGTPTLRRAWELPTVMLQRERRKLEGTQFDLQQASRQFRTVVEGVKHATITADSTRYSSRLT